MWGSSPLARGLQDTWCTTHKLPGIIPARAGFTHQFTSNIDKCGDHPRSRGVYSQARVEKLLRGGSSPLARGLLHHESAASALLGIIPARAGFTWRGWGVPPMGTDHPRSRGVYFVIWIICMNIRGSSPLARGLHDIRAPGRQRAADHPRSRGVYDKEAVDQEVARGSSPLARGLRGEGGPGLEGRRIIPARAGFTRSRWAGRRGSGDHPRSRGVYARDAHDGPRGQGSSPLARGLPCFLLTHAQSIGIIPARAGFTIQTTRLSYLNADHPRSRGVYLVKGQGRKIGVGSSPLARGLLPL